MFSGLYGDLPQAKDEAEEKSEAEGVTWSGSKVLAPPPAAKRAAAAMPPPSVVLRGSNSRGRGREYSATGRGRGRSSTTSVATAAAPQGLQNNPTPSNLQQAGASVASLFNDNIADEYDPARPNDYDAIRKRREQLRLEAEAEAELQERLREIRELEELERRRDEEETGEVGVASGAGLGSSMQQSNEDARRAALNLSGEEAYLRRMGLSSGVVGNAPMDVEYPNTAVGGLGASSSRSTLSATAAAPPPPSSGPKGMPLAQRMLEKMGWKEGEGLGRQRQGIAAPLAVEKTDARSGRVVALEPIVPPPITSAPTEPPSFAPPTTATALPFNAGPPSKVVVLRNVVPPGAVDESLDEEIGMECSKYGDVDDVLIFEVTEPNFPEEEAVRVFVQFSTQEAAAAALTELHGRFFGGRTVRAKYFDEVRFLAGDLAPRKEEIS